MTATALRVNGLAVTVDCDPDTALLYALRNDLGLTAAKFGCGQGLCGSCTVLVDGRPIRSCDTPLWSVQDADVTTLEGVGTAEDPHPLQRSFIDHQAIQCGYCVNGMIMTAVAALRENPDLDEAGAREALAGNLCRCGAHRRILAAVLAARPGAGTGPS